MSLFQERKDLELPSDQAALEMFDVIKGQQTAEVSTLLEENNINVVPVPANCTDSLQPMDLSINQAAKEFMHSRFREWYATELQKQFGRWSNVGITCQPQNVQYEATGSSIYGL